MTECRRPLVALLMVLAWPLFCLLQLGHWLGFLIDEILFRGWRRVEVREPLFVLGPPRSGTTHLHHVLSRDENTTTFRMWECLFGLSVTGRKLLLGLGRLDRALGRPLGRAGGWFGRRFLAGMDDVHPFSLNAPEEDFLALMPAMQCFILVVAFPRAEWLWRTARLDEAVDAAARRRLMRFYRACVRKHLYVHGTDRRLLSKNASFSGMAEALLETFPDARIIACTRDPKKTVPSQLSAIRPGLNAAGFDRVPEVLRDRFVELLKFYYLHLERTARARPGQVVVVDNAALHGDLHRTVADALQALGLGLDDAFARALADLDRASRGFSSVHAYTLEEFGLTAEEIEERFAEVYRIRRFGRVGRSAAGKGDHGDGP
ncbi:MAG: sulfotransferase [Wenzhouxiangellaceae bacterium]|nr:sulfotransferase [Wenzhouxiangellaceae bacterium]